MNKMDDNKAKEVIAFNINQILESQGHSRYWLAKETDEWQSTIANVCHGRSVCGAGLLTRIAKALDVNPDNLLEIPKKMKTSA